MFTEITLLDLDTLMAVKKAAPRVTGVSFGQAQECVKALRQLSDATGLLNDGEGHTYWNATLKAVVELNGLDVKLVGRACREMGLTLWRKSDGYHVAWSRQQLDILNKFFKLDE